MPSRKRGSEGARLDWAGQSRGVNGSQRGNFLSPLPRVLVVLVPLLVEANCSK